MRRIGPPSSIVGEAGRTLSEGDQRYFIGIAKPVAGNSAEL